MTKKKKNNHSFWKRVRFKYRISVINENTLAEIWKFRASIFTGIVLFLIISSIVVIVTSAIIIGTPIRYYLPGYLDSEVREKSIRTAIHVDSLEQQMNSQELYIRNMRKVLDGTMEIDSVANVPDTVRIDENNPALAKSQIERDFVQRYEEQEKYELSVFASSNQPNENVTFFRPAKGVVFNKFEPKKKRYGIMIQVGQKETISAMLEGVVMSQGFDVVDGYVIQIQHKTGFVSIYKNCTHLLKKTGDKVKTGEAIAVIENKDTAVDVSLYLELWHNGNPVNAEDYFSFK